MKHYNEVELLERYYIPSSEEDEVRSHLAICEPCNRRFERLSGKLRDSACSSTAGIENRPETFWTRQRIAIERKIDERSRTRVAGRRARWSAIAATLAIVLGGGVIFRSQMMSVSPATNPSSISSAPEFAPVPPDVLTAIADPDDVWETEELKPFGDAVQWESWMSSPSNASGGPL